MEKYVYSILAIDLDEGITEITDNNSVTDQPITAIICHKNRGMT